MIFEDLKTKIESHQFDEAFEILSEVFGAVKPMYNKLMDRYIDPPENFSSSSFAKKLKVFVIRSKKRD